MPHDLVAGNITMANSSNPEETKIIRLEEVFQTFPELPINIDIKTNNDTLIDLVCNLWILE